MTQDNQQLIDQTGIDMLMSMFKYDPEQRPTARKLLQHKWFDDVRVELAKSYILEF